MFSMTMACPGSGSQLLNIPHRPSHPSHNTAMRPPFLIHPGSGSPLSNARTRYMPSRPQLHIITNGSANVQRPTPTRHPALVKTAPIILSASDESVLSFTFPTQPQPPVGVPIIVGHDIDMADTQGLSNQINGALPPPPGRPKPTVKPRRPSHSRHKRKLSDKFKSLFSALHLKKDDRIPFFQPDMLSSLTLNDSTEVLARLRPHRSPGTASFLISRHLAPDPTLPTSAHSSSTAFSVSSRPTFADKRRLCFDSSLEISHFSNPTTLSSAAPSVSGRSISSSVVLERRPSIKSRLGVEEGVKLKAGVRRCRSLPDMTM